MFGFLKQTIPSSEFGLTVLRYADEFITNDACRSLASGFTSYDASRGWMPVFESNGVPLQRVKLYLRFYTHCILQAVFKAYPSSQRRSMVHGAILGIRDTPDGYEFGKAFDELEAVFDGRYKFDPRVATLSDSGRLSFLAEPTAHISVAKYLLDRFVLPHIQNGRAYIDDFQGYSGTVGSSLATTHRAMNSIASKIKIGP
jgi:hypothetical protein